MPYSTLTAKSPLTIIGDAANFSYFFNLKIFTITSTAPRAAQSSRLIHLLFYSTFLFTQPNQHTLLQFLPTIYLYSPFPAKLSKFSETTPQEQSQSHSTLSIFASSLQSTPTTIDYSPSNIHSPLYTSLLSTAYQQSPHSIFEQQQFSLIISLLQQLSLTQKKPFRSVGTISNLESQCSLKK